MHRVWSALSQVKAPSCVRPGQRDPQHFHRAYTGSVLLRTSHPHVCAQSAGKQSAWRAGRQQPVSARCLRDRTSRSDAGLSAWRDEIMQERGSRMSWVGAAAGIRGFRAYCLRSRRCCVGTSPVLPAVNRVIAAGIPAAAGVPVLEGDVLQGRIRQGPPCMRWGALSGLAAPSTASCPALLAPRAPLVPGTRVRGRSPGSLHVPRGRPQGGARFRR
jgi:hypothetical protein